MSKIAEKISVALFGNATEEWVRVIDEAIGNSRIRRSTLNDLIYNRDYLNDKLWDAEQEIHDLKQDLESISDFVDADILTTEDLIATQEKQIEQLQAVNTINIENYSRLKSETDKRIAHLNSDYYQSGVNVAKWQREQVRNNAAFEIEVAELKRANAQLRADNDTLSEVVAKQLSREILAWLEPSEQIEPPRCLKPLDALQFNNTFVMGNMTTPRCAA